LKRIEQTGSAGAGSDSFQILHLLVQIGELAKQAWPLVVTNLRLTEGTEEMALEPSK
jgi:hypothetical protein